MVLPPKPGDKRGRGGHRETREYGPPTADLKQMLSQVETQDGAGLFLRQCDVRRAPRCAAQRRRAGARGEQALFFAR